MKHEIGHIISLLHSNYWSWLSTVEEDHIKDCNVYYPKKKFTTICKNMSTRNV
jgi:hypothetical protein